MASPITIIKNDKLLFEATTIKEAAEYLSKSLKINMNQCFNYVERGYVYDITYTIKEDEYRFIAPAPIAIKRRNDLEKRNHHNARRVWLVPANPKKYDVASAFSYYETIDWKRSVNYEKGDILFLYISEGVQKVQFKVEVLQGLVKDNDFNYDKKFWLDEEEYKRLNEWDYARIRLVDVVDTDALSLAKLREYGLKSKIQGPEQLTAKLRDYIMSFFQKDLTEGFYSDEINETLEEGSSKTVLVNRYERNHIARKECINVHGVKCHVCEMDFESTYGKVGKDFIHVHHIIPLSEIKQGYIVDPIHDLIPVCPNCHAMLHRKENGSYLSIEELKERMKNK